MTSTNELIIYWIPLMKLLFDGSPFWNECYADGCEGLRQYWNEISGVVTVQLLSVNTCDNSIELLFFISWQNIHKDQLTVGIRPLVAVIDVQGCVLSVSLL